MLDRFPEELHYRCKLRATAERRTLKEFVIRVLEDALNQPVLDSTHESGQDAIRRSSSQDVGAPAPKNIRDKKAKAKGR